MRQGSGRDWNGKRADDHECTCLAAATKAKEEEKE